MGVAVLERDDAVRRSYCAMVEAVGYLPTGFASVEALASVCGSRSRRFEALVLAFPGDVSSVLRGLERICRAIPPTMSGLLILEERQIAAVHQARWALPRDFILSPFDVEEFQQRLRRCAAAAAAKLERLAAPNEAGLAQG